MSEDTFKRRRRQGTEYDFKFEDHNTDAVEFEKTVGDFACGPLTATDRRVLGYSLKRYLMTQLHEFMLKNQRESLPGYLETEPESRIVNLFVGGHRVGYLDHDTARQLFEPIRAIEMKRKVLAVRVRFLGSQDDPDLRPIIDLPELGQLGELVTRTGRAWGF